jgi:3-hydroxybutyryl-CoA dehydrogenase
MKKLKNKIIGFISPYVDRNELGMKSGKGFYCYPQPSYEQDSFLNEDKDLSAMENILVATLIENGVLVASKDVVSAEDVDRAWTIGTRLDAGPFEILEAIGQEQFMTMYSGLASVGLFTERNVSLVADYLQKTAR